MANAELQRPLSPEGDRLHIEIWERLMSATGKEQ
jgi:hypothetical protein